MVERGRLVLLLAAALLLLAGRAAAKQTRRRQGSTGAGEGHQCIHDTVVTPLLTGLVGQYANVSDETHVHAAELLTEALEQEAHVRRLAAAPIRIHLDYSDIDASTVLTSREKQLIKEKLMPTAAAYIQANVRVKNPVSGKLFLPRLCATQWTGVNICQQLRDVGWCFTTPHNADYFGAGQYCPDSPGVCVNSSSGTGVQDADLIIYVTAQAQACADQTDTGCVQKVATCEGTTEAFAAACVLDAAGTYGAPDRPLAGVVNFCSGRLSMEDADFGIQLDTAVHEMMHALGFSSSLYPLWQKLDGTGSWGTASGGTANVLSVDATTGLTYMVSDTVKSVARAQANCPTLTGALMENDGGTATALTHWEARAYDNELMIGQGDSDRFILSDLTLALLTDTGWYTTVEQRALPFGRFAGTTSQGCDFDTASCQSQLSFPSPPRSTFSNTQPFCHREEPSKAQDTTAQCTWDYRALGLCTGTPLNTEASGCTLTVPYRTDVCYEAVPSRLALKAKDMGLPSYDSLGEYQGAWSRCIPQDPQTSIMYNTMAIKPAGAGCYRVECISGELWVTVLKAKFKCPTGQYVDLATATAGSATPFSSGRLGPCPDNTYLCEALVCPNDCNGNGSCWLGACSCYTGWDGSDCSQAVDSAMTTLMFDSQPQPPPPGSAPPPPPSPPPPPPPPPVIAENLDLVMEFDLSADAAALFLTYDAFTGSHTLAAFSADLQERASAAMRVPLQHMYVESIQVLYTKATDGDPYAGVQGHPACQQARYATSTSDLGGGDASRVLRVRTRASYVVPDPTAALMADIETIRDAVLDDPLSVFASDHSIFAKVSSATMYNCQVLSGGATSAAHVGRAALSTVIMAIVAVMAAAAL